MTDSIVALTTASLLAVVAVLALAGAVLITRRLGKISADLRRTDARLVAETPLLARRLATQRLRLASSDAASERALRALAHLDARLDSSTQSLAAQRTLLAAQRSRIIATRTTVERLKRGARILSSAINARRTFLG